MALFFVYCSVNFEVALATYTQRKKGIIFAPNHGHSGCKTARHSTCAKIPENRHNPYLDTVENGSTPGKSSIHDTQVDAKAPKPGN